MSSSNNSIAWGSPEVEHARRHDSEEDAVLADLAARGNLYLSPRGRFYLQGEEVVPEDALPVQISVGQLRREVAILRDRREELETFEHALEELIADLEAIEADALPA